MSKHDYSVKADGWVAGKWRAKGSTVPLTATQAKYENVALTSEARKSETEPKVQLTGSLDDPTVKSSGLAEKAKAEEGRTKK